ncbi:MAG TPA: hypothetical protein P5136_01590 [Methanofastidiosum sp.]|nr:hypothetical protein [Methanofastidiosum sp.]
MEVVSNVSEIPEKLKYHMRSAYIMTREVDRIEKYPAHGTFEAISDVRASLRKRTYCVGSMASTEPIAIAKGKDILISKWHNIGPEDANRIDGVILSEDFREGDIYVLLFKRRRGGSSDV